MTQIIVSPSRKNPEDIEIEELLERKNAKILRKVERPPLDVSDHCLGEIVEYYTCMALVVGRYEDLLTRRSHISRGFYY
jgi:hypothetical protein